VLEGVWCPFNTFILGPASILAIAALVDLCTVLDRAEK